MKKETVETLKKMKYEEFLQTDYWKMVSEQARIRAGYKCQLCGCNDKTLHVHHNSYEHHGEEHKHLEDLVCLCEDCHNLYHNWNSISAKLEDENNILKMRLEFLKNYYKDLREERDYAEWKLRNFYDSQKEVSRREIALIVEDNLNDRDKKWETPF